MQTSLITSLENTFNPSDFKNVTLNEALDKIKNGSFQKIIDDFRAIKNQELKKNRKKNLPSFSFNGTFKDAVKNDCFVKSSGLFHFDIDNIDDVEKHKQLISSLPGIVFCFVSTSGTGLKGAVRVPVGSIQSDSDFKAVFSYFQAFFKEHGYIIDNACKDVRRLCFVSNDPDIYINYDAAIINPVIAKPPPQQQPKLNPSSTTIDRCVNIILQAVNGSRHEARLRAGRLAGGYIASGEANENEIIAALIRASDAKADKGVTCSSELKTLYEAIENGKLTPIEKQFFVNHQPSFIKSKQENLSIAPFPGIMADIVSETLRIANKPQHELSILSALIGMAAAIGGNYKLPGGGRLNLYGIGISSTGTGKDKAMTAGVLTAYASGTEIMGYPGSGAAIEDSLSEHDTKMLFNIDEVAHFIAAMNDSKQTHNASVASNLLKLFSASRGSYITRKLANSSANTQKTCINPCVNLLGFACPEKLGEAFGSASNIDDGLIGRVLFAKGLDDVKPRRDKGEFKLPEYVSAIAKAINNSADIVIQFDDDADKLLDELILLYDSASVSSDNPFARNLKTRSYEKLERIAGVLAVWSGHGKPIIKKEHVEWSKAFIDYSDSIILEFTGNHVHGGKVQNDAAKIVAVMGRILSGEISILKIPHIKMVEMGILPRSAILKASHLAKKDFDSAIEHLEGIEKLFSGNVEIDGEQYKALKFL